MAGAVINAVFLLPARRIQRIETSAKEQSVRRLARKITMYI